MILKQEEAKKIVQIEELWEVLEEYQKLASPAKATINFHITKEMPRTCLFYGPLAHNSAFVGENLNFTLTKTFISCNSTRYAIMFFDMAQLCDILGFSSLRSTECICGHYVVTISP